jgi:DNA-binding transcriptional regulator/RsmH inhibitor MraZ
MLDPRRLTHNEREVLTDALCTEKERHLQRRRRSRAAVVRADVQWRLVIIEQLLDRLVD